MDYSILVVKIGSTLNSKSIFSLGTSIPSGANLNTYTTPGNYYSGDVDDLVNHPGSGSSRTMQLLVIPRATASRVFQVALVYNPSAAPDGFIRAMSGETSWTSWKQL